MRLEAEAAAQAERDTQWAPYQVALDGLLKVEVVVDDPEFPARVEILAQTRFLWKRQFDDFEVAKKQGRWPPQLPPSVDAWIKQDPGPGEAEIYSCLLEDLVVEEEKNSDKEVVESALVVVEMSNGTPEAVVESELVAEEMSNGRLEVVEMGNGMEEKVEGISWGVEEMSKHSQHIFEKASLEKIKQEQF